MRNKNKDEAPKIRKPSLDTPSVEDSVDAPAETLSVESPVDENVEANTNTPVEETLDATIYSAQTEDTIIEEDPLQVAIPAEEDIASLSQEDNLTQEVEDSEEESLPEMIKKDVVLPKHKAHGPNSKGSRKSKSDRMKRNTLAVNQSLNDIDPDVLSDEQPVVKKQKKSVIKEEFKENKIVPIKVNLASPKVKKEVDPVKAKKRQKKSLRFFVIGIIAVAIVVGSTIFYGTGLSKRLDSPLTINGQQVDSAEFSFMYHYVLIENGVDIFAADTQEMLNSTSDDPNYATNRDYFLDLTAKQMQTTQILYDDATSHGYRIEDSHYTLARSYVDWLSGKAEVLGVSLDTYIRGVFGSQVDEQCVINSLAKKYFTEDYSSDEKLVELQASLDQSEEAYNANSNIYDVVDYKVLRITYEQRDEAFITTANLHANEIIESMGHDQSLFELCAAEYFSGETHDRLLEPDSTLVSNTRYADLDHTDIRDWLFDSARTPGDATIFPDSDGFPIIVCFVDRNRQNDPLRNVRMVQVSFGQDELGNGLSLGDAQSLAQEIYEYVGDESSFLEVENLYTDEILNGYVTVSQSADTYRGKFETVIDDWIYTNGRAAGDKVILESENAFYVVYIVSESANPEWFDRVNSFIRMNNYQAYMNEMQTEYPYEFKPAGLAEIQDVP